MQRKSKQLLIRVSETELAIITRNAREAGMSVSAFLREAGMARVTVCDTSFEPPRTGCDWPS